MAAPGVGADNGAVPPLPDAEVRAGLDPATDFDRVIVVKVNAVERLRAELAPKRWAGEPIAMGTNTDPYQHAEASQSK